MMMSDLIYTVETTARDPLVGGFALMVVGGLISRMLFKQRPIWRAVARVIFLVLLTILLLRDGIVPYQPLQLTGAPYHDTIAGILKIAWWLWAAWFLVGFVRAVVIFERRPLDGKLVQDIISALIYLTAAFAIIDYVFDLPIQGLLATSGAIAIILGLALQSTLNDVFSGLVLSLGHPYRPGDQVKFDGGTEGKVVEMNWRATHVLTARQDLAIVPNSVIAKSKIVNLNFPSPLHAITLQVQLGASPSNGGNILGLALLNSRLVLSFPHPVVRVVSLDARQTEFEVSFFVERPENDVEVQNELFDLIFRHVLAAGARLAPPKNAPYQPSDDKGLDIREVHPEAILDLSGLFVGLPPSERAAIATNLKQTPYEKGDILVKPGIVLQSLFIVGRGVLSVTSSDSGHEKELLRFGPGDYFGEMGLLADTPTGASITALTPCIVHELAKADLRPILEARPHIAQELCRTLAQRLAAGRGLTSVELDKTEPTSRLSARLSSQIRRLFELSGAN